MYSDRSILFLPLAIGKFNELYPNIKVRILEQGTNNCMESVLCNESDFGINMNNVTNSSIDFTPLVNEPFVLPVGVTIHWPKSSL
ncbi:putative transcriptional regulator LYSR-type [Shigella flexneri 1485-80]|nr:putative transcriptional regulator LYSR-type [Shigella flexneri 1485-80]